ncbi:hypothetical protein HDA32_005769 [Spinactinospora alkalitolerans]|uniref:N-acetylmuramoyl-L-alanine amidase n=1 Tax=Spinactinospora alkalitolerans TaxID=687207 RepID=A0A852U377_9ACTN|nr:peptidoglycan recognition family protein [Spinactinospora alkalitolerans]NYE50649.1 hypothetical protein [Spinactinospora alkalitolerans]
MAVTGGVLLSGAADLGTAREALAAAEPTLYHRGHWNASRARRNAQVIANGPDHVVVHHTATANSTDYSKEHAFELSRRIQRYHMQNNGWDDIGQQLTISRGGHIMEGRNTSLPAIRQGRHVVGAHTANHNNHTIGIENEGTYSSGKPTDELLESLADTCTWLCLTYRLDPGGAIVGHRDYNVTSCPGDGLYALLPALRREVGARMAKVRARWRQMGGTESRGGNAPAFPDPPVRERKAEFYHGPTLGEHDRTR